jgi:hypothetical protein
MILNILIWSALPLLTGVACFAYIVYDRSSVTKWAENTGDNEDALQHP